MTENYKIITNENKLREFIDWLPELGCGECYYYSLFARSKYDSTGVLKSDKQQLKRGTSTKEFLFEKIKQLEIEVGSYHQKHSPIPQETLALYITPNPRSYEKAAIKSVKTLLDLVTRPYTGYNPHQEVLSAIQTSSGKKHFMDFDFDKVEIEEVYPELIKCINEDAISIVKTRGGFHVLVIIDKIRKEYQRGWYNGISLINGCDVRGSDGLLPVVGCYQGGFTPELILKYE